MPRDAQSEYSLPPGYLATTGETILASQHNPPLEDIAEALTGSLARNGSGAMLGPLRAFSGDAGAPGMAFGSASSTGWFLTSGGGIGIAVGGVQVAEVTSSGLVSLPIGMPLPVLDDELPPLSIWADGRNVGRTAYPRLFAKWGTRHGAGDGTTTFGMPDLRGRSLIGKDNFGGTDANRLTGAAFTAGSRLAVGSTVGVARVALALAELAAHTHGATIVHPAQQYTKTDPTGGLTGATSAGNVLVTQTTASTIPPANTSVTTASTGSGTPHLNIQPSMTCGWAIFAGE